MNLQVSSTIIDKLYFFTFFFCLFRNIQVIYLLILAMREGEVRDFFFFNHFYVHQWQCPSIFFFQKNQFFQAWIEFNTFVNIFANISQKFFFVRHAVKKFPVWWVWDWDKGQKALKTSALRFNGSVVFFFFWIIYFIPVTSLAPCRSVRKHGRRSLKYTDLRWA